MIHDFLWKFWVARNFVVYDHYYDMLWPQLGGMPQNTHINIQNYPNIQLALRSHYYPHVISTWKTKLPLWDLNLSLIIQYINTYNYLYIYIII
jgi:hypothetical protein